MSVILSILTGWSVQSESETFKGESYGKLGLGDSKKIAERC